jgi:hypothetical protein
MRAQQEKAAEMIIPTPEYDPMFADDGVPFRDKMIGRIRQEFPDLLGPRPAQLETDQDLADLSRHVQDCFGERPHRKNSAA